MKRTTLATIVSLSISGTALANEAAEGPSVELPADDGNAPSGTIEDSALPGIQPTTLGGYGEMHFSRAKVEGEDSESEIDFHRMVLYIGKSFNEKLRFYSELEIEHAIAADGHPGEVAMEQAYVEYQLADEGSAMGEMGMRAGIVLMPMGIINQWHEPPVFHGVERPMVDKVIIPSTWREGGAGIYGKPLPELSYELYVVGGLNPLGFSKSSGIRGGRQKVGEARADGLATAGRVEYQLGTSTVFGLSGYAGQSGKNADEVDASVLVLGYGADARTKYRGFEARAVVAGFSVGDTEELNATMDVDGNPLVSASSQLFGAYGELAYDVLQSTTSALQLLPFARVEYFNTDPDDKARKVMQYVSGLSFRPVSQVVFKGDFIARRPVSGNSENIFDLGVGFLY